MATRISGHDNRSLRDLMYFRPEREIDTYHRTRQDNPRASESFRNRTRELVSRVKESSVYRSTLASVRRLKNRGRLDVITQLIDEAAMQQATPIMQRIIMANPRVRTRYRKRMLEGYHGEYQEPNKWEYKHSDYTYRQIMNGIAEIDEPEITATTYHLQIDDVDVMSSFDRSEARMTWAAINRVLDKGGDDPTSIYNARLR